MLQDTMKTILANQFALYIKAQGYHWNVKGMFFPQLHDFFGKFYEDVQGSIDATAEEIRTLNIDAPAGLTVFSALRTISDGTATEASQMLMDLYESNAELLNQLTSAFEQAERAKKYGLADFLSSRIDAHEKHAWMLRSIVAQQPNVTKEEVEQTMTNINERYDFANWAGRRNK